MSEKLNTNSQEIMIKGAAIKVATEVAESLGLKMVSEVLDESMGTMRVTLEADADQMREFNEAFAAKVGE